MRNNCDDEVNNTKTIHYEIVCRGLLSSVLAEKGKLIGLMGQDSANINIMVHPTIQVWVSHILRIEKNESFFMRLVGTVGY